MRGFLRYGCVLVLSLPLSGCLGMDWLFGGEVTNYRLEMDHDDADVQSYLDGILKDRLEKPLENGDDPDELQRRETYREQTIRRDLIKALRAKGYYDARVRFIDDPEQQMAGTYRVRAGDLYHISSVGFSAKGLDEYFAGVELNEGDPLDAQNVLDQQAALYKALDADHCYFDLKVNHAVKLDETNKTASLEYLVDAGEEATFGGVSFKGQETVRTSHLRKLVPWKEGDCFRRSQIETLRTRLFESGLFSRADAVIPDTPNADGTVDLVLDVKERAHRTVRFGLNYYTDTGVGAIAGWEHRNFLGAAEKLNADLTVSMIEQSLKGSFAKPFFMRNDQTLNLNTSLRRQDTDAFEEIGIDLGGNVSRRFNKRLSGSLGAKYSLVRINEENSSTNTYGMLSFPGALTYDSRDNALDPRKGWYLQGTLAPFVDTLGESDPFVKMLLSGSTYIDMGKSPDVVLALRGQIGSIAGADAANVPATERFYAGGGGSVRGYGFQEVGPMRNGDPEGGRSIVTGAAELRFKLTETIGMVGFVDAGSVTDSTSPDFSDPAIGAGLGLRYYTGFGPIRFDIAVPMTQKDKTSDAFQIYISIGQAF